LYGELKISWIGDDGADGLRIYIIIIRYGEIRRTGEIQVVEVSIEDENFAISFLLVRRIT